MISTGSVSICGLSYRQTDILWLYLFFISSHIYFFFIGRLITIISLVSTNWLLWLHLFFHTRVMVYPIIFCPNSTFSIKPELTRKRGYRSIGQASGRGASWPAGCMVIFVLIDIMACIRYNTRNSYFITSTNTRTHTYDMIYLSKVLNNTRSSFIRSCTSFRILKHVRGAK